MEKLYRGTMIHPHTLALTVRTLRNINLSEDPTRSADLVFSALEDADKAMKRGQPPVRAEREIRKTIERSVMQQERATAAMPADRGKSQVKRALENRGRGGEEGFIPPGIDRRRDNPSRQEEERAPPRPEGVGPDGEKPDVGPDDGKPDTEPPAQNPNNRNSPDQSDQNTTAQQQPEQGKSTQNPKPMEGVFSYPVTD
jgi:hypothetical protein